MAVVALIRVILFFSAADQGHAAQSSPMDDPRGGRGAGSHHTREERQGREDYRQERPSVLQGTISRSAFRRPACAPTVLPQICVKLFAKETVFKAHLTGGKHIKVSGGRATRLARRVARTLTQCVYAGAQGSQDTTRPSRGSETREQAGQQAKNGGVEAGERSTSLPDLRVGARTGGECEHQQWMCPEG